MGPVLTAKANRLGNKAHNPYLQHKTVSGWVRCGADGCSAVQRRVASECRCMICTPHVGCDKTRPGKTGQDRTRQDKDRSELLTSSRSKLVRRCSWLV